MKGKSKRRNVHGSWLQSKLHFCLNSTDVPAAVSSMNASKGRGLSVGNTMDDGLRREQEKLMEMYSKKSS